MIDFIDSLRWLRLFTFTCVVLAAGGTGSSRVAMAANPSNKDFDAGIAVHGKTAAAGLAKQAQTLYEESNAATLKFAEAVKSNKVARLSWQPLGQNDVRLNQLRRIAQQLEILGETAGVDYQMRANSLFRTTGDIIDAFRAEPTSQRQLDKVRLALQKQEPARIKEVERLTKMAREGQWEAAETELYRFLDQLGVATTCLFNPEKRPIYAPFAEVQAAIDQAMRQARVTQAKQLLTERRQAETPDFAAVLSEVQAAATSLAASGTATLDGSVLTGPDAITAIGERWAEVQVKSIRCRTLDWLLANSMEAYGGTGEGQKPSSIVSEYANFSAAMMNALAQLIESDANRTSGPDAAALYVAYLRACAPLIRRSANQNLAPVLNPALQSLANRAPQFPAEVAAYTEGTGDLLRWRARVARGLAVARADTFPSIDRLMFEATRDEGNYLGLYSANASSASGAALHASAPEVMLRPIERLQGKQAHALDVVRLGGNGPVAIARYRARSYANIPAPLDLAAEIDALKVDLMVSEDRPALSMFAAVAVDSAERGDLVAAGGTIVNQYLESLTTRFAALPTAASILTPLGTIPPEQTDSSYRNQVLMRFDLTPNWVQHDFFFAELSNSPGATE